MNKSFVSTKHRPGGLVVLETIEEKPGGANVSLFGVVNSIGVEASAPAASPLETLERRREIAQHNSLLYSHLSDDIRVPAVGRHEVREVGDPAAGEEGRFMRCLFDDVDAKLVSEIDDAEQKLAGGQSQ